MYDTRNLRLIESNVLDEETTARLRLRDIVAGFQSSSIAARVCAVVDPAHTAGVVDDVNVDHGRAVFVFNAELAASRRVVHLRGNVRVRGFVSDAAAVDQVRGCAGGRLGGGGGGRSGVGCRVAVDAVVGGRHALDVDCFVNLDGGCRGGDQAAEIGGRDVRRVDGVIRYGKMGLGIGVCARARRVDDFGASGWHAGRTDRRGRERAGVLGACIFCAPMRLLVDADKALNKGQ